MNLNLFDFIRRLRGLSNEEKENLSTLVNAGDTIGGKPARRKDRRPPKRKHGGRLRKRRRR